MKALLFALVLVGLFITSCSPTPYLYQDGHRYHIYEHRRHHYYYYPYDHYRDHGHNRSWH